MKVLRYGFMVTCLPIMLLASDKPTKKTYAQALKFEISEFAASVVVATGSLESIQNNMTDEDFKAIEEAENNAGQAVKKEMVAGKEIIQDDNRLTTAELQKEIAQMNKELAQSAIWCSIS